MGMMQSWEWEGLGETRQLEIFEASHLWISPPASDLASKGWVWPMEFS